MKLANWKKHVYICFWKSIFTKIDFTCNIKSKNEYLVSFRLSGKTFNSLINITYTYVSRSIDHLYLVEIFESHLFRREILFLFPFFFRYYFDIDKCSVDFCCVECFLHNLIFKVSLLDKRKAGWIRIRWRRSQTLNVVGHWKNIMQGLH
jgi:hypothetical protein